MLTRLETKEIWGQSNKHIFFQPWWLGGRALASHSVQSPVSYLGGSNPRINVTDIVDLQFEIQTQTTNNCYEQ